VLNQKTARPLPGQIAAAPGGPVEPLVRRGALAAGPQRHPPSVTCCQSTSPVVAGRRVMSEFVVWRH